MPPEKSIRIQPNGPYVVSGDLPLSEMAPVHTMNGEPVAWHTLGELPVERGSYALCRCGQSSDKPFCDGTHNSQAFDGAESADERPFAERAQQLPADGATVADDGPLCVHAGFCGTRTTNVWELAAKAGDDARERMREMVQLCPSGRLAYYAEGSDEPTEPDLPEGIAVIPGGPLWVRGGVPIEGSGGQAWEVRNRVTLCRCGASANKPYCDGSHADLHFDER